MAESDTEAGRPRDGRSFPRRLGVEENASYPERKLLVLRAAAKAFSEKGFSGTSIDDIARDLGVTKPTIYYYGRSKDDLVGKCLELGSEMIAEEVRELESRHLSGREKLEAFLGHVTQSITEDFPRLFVRIDPNALNQKARAAFIRTRRQFLRVVTDIIREGVADGTLAVDNPELAAFTLIGASNFIGQWYRPGGRFRPEDISQGMTRIFLDGIRGPKGAAARRKR